MRYICVEKLSQMGERHQSLHLSHVLMGWVSLVFIIWPPSVRNHCICPPLYSHYYIGKSKTAFNITVPKGPLSIRMPSQNRAYPCSAGLKAPKGNKCQPIWEPGMKKEAKRWKNSCRTSHLWAPLSATCRVGDHSPAASSGTALPFCEGFVILSSQIEARLQSTHPLLLVAFFWVLYERHRH